MGPDDAKERLTYDRVVAVAGQIPAWKVSAILALGATVDELEQAVALVSAEAGMDGAPHVARASRVGSIHDILAGERIEGS
ncbi:MAG: hypothetical protein R3F55_05795 [Alphaproteobacteria bacterium]